MSRRGRTVPPGSLTASTEIAALLLGGGGGGGVRDGQIVGVRSLNDPASLCVCRVALATKKRGATGDRGYEEPDKLEAEDIRLDETIAFEPHHPDPFELKTPYPLPGNSQYVLYKCEEWRPLPASTIVLETRVASFFARWEKDSVFRKRFHHWLLGAFLTPRCIIRALPGSSSSSSPQRSRWWWAESCEANDLRLVRTVPEEADVLEVIGDTRIVLTFASSDSVAASRVVDEHKSDLNVEIVDTPPITRLIKLAFPASPSARARGILLRGPPGTGKTKAVMRLCEVARRRHPDDGFALVAPKPSEVLASAGEGMRVALGELKRYREKFETRGGLVVLFLDELDAYCDRESSPAVRALSRFFDEENGRDAANRIKTLVIGATNRPDVLPRSLRRFGRLEREITFPLPSAKERFEFLCGLLRITTPNETSTEIDEQLREIAREALNGCSPADIARVVRRCALDVSTSASTLDKRLLIDALYSRHARAKAQVDGLLLESGSRESSFVRSAIGSVATERETIVVAGQEEAKRALKLALEWPLRRGSTLERFGLKTTARGVLLHGPPGCGKTALVRSVMASFRGAIAFLSLSSADVYSSGVGEAEACVRRLFADARASSPSVVFLDEIDALVCNRGIGSSGGAGGSTDEVSPRVLSTLLNEMDGVEGCEGVVVVAATNRLDSVDPALLRPGRFDLRVFVGLPPAREVLESCLLPLSPDFLETDVMENIDAIAESARGMSGAEVSGAVRAGVSRCVGAGRRRLSREDLHEGIRRVLTGRAHDDSVV